MAIRSDAVVVAERSSVGSSPRANRATGQRDRPAARTALAAISAFVGAMSLILPRNDVTAPHKGVAQETNGTTLVLQPAGETVMRKPLSRSELRRHGHEGHLVVGLAQARGERADERPEQIVGEIAVDEEEVFHVLLADDEQAAGLVRAR